MSSRAIVTLADSNYFDLLIELIDSIKKHDKNSNTSICVLDAGLTPNQNQIIKNKDISPNKKNIKKLDLSTSNFKILKRDRKLSKYFIGL